MKVITYKDKQGKTWTAEYDRSGLAKLYPGRPTTNGVVNEISGNPTR